MKNIPLIILTAAVLACSIVPDADTPGTTESQYTYTPETWDISGAQALLDAGEPVDLGPGTYDLGDETITMAGPAATLRGHGLVKLEHTGSGNAILLQPGSNGTLSGIEVRGDYSGHGLHINGSHIRVINVRVAKFGSCVYYDTGQVATITGGYIGACDIGIEFNEAKAQNMIKIDSVMFRSNGVHVSIYKSRSVIFVSCNFEAARGPAIVGGALGGGRIHSLVFRDCWFEQNNKDHVPADGRAEVELVSPAPFLIRNVRFEDCYWGHVSPVSPSSGSAAHIRLGQLDVVTTAGGFPVDPTIMEWQ